MCVLSKRYKYNKVDSCQYEYYQNEADFVLHLKFYISNMEFDSDAFNTGFPWTFLNSKLPSPSITPAEAQTNVGIIDV
jgi:hypothetical protein